MHAIHYKITEYSAVCTDRQTMPQTLSITLKIAVQLGLSHSQA